MDRDQPCNNINGGRFEWVVQAGKIYGGVNNNLTDAEQLAAALRLVRQEEEEALRAERKEAERVKQEGACAVLLMLLAGFAAGALGAALDLGYLLMAGGYTIVGALILGAWS